MEKAGPIKGADSLSFPWEAKVFANSREFFSRKNGVFFLYGGLFFLFLLEIKKRGRQLFGKKVETNGHLKEKESL